MSESAVVRSEWRTLVAGAAVIAGILLVGKGIPFVLRWQDEERMVARTVIAAARDAADAGRRLPALMAMKRKLDADIVVVDSAVISTSSDAESGALLMSRVSDAAEAAGVVVGSAQVVRGAKAGGHFTRTRTRAQLTGDLVAVVQFLSDLETGSPMISIRDLSITQPERALPAGKPEVLQVELTVEALSKRASK